MAEPYLRIPLSEAEAHRAELALTRTQRDFAWGTLDEARAIIALAAADDTGIPLRQSVVHEGFDPVEPIDVVATVKALVAEVLDLSRKLDDAYYRTATLKIERDEADIAWRDQVKETTKFADLYRGTAESKAAGEAYKARNEERCACGHIRLEHIGVRCMILGCGCRDLDGIVADEARASIAIDEGEDAVSTVTDFDDLPKHREAPPPTKKPAPAAKPADTRAHVATRRDAHGRRFWDGQTWVANLDGAIGFTLDSWATTRKPRGSRLVARDDVPALLAEDAAKDAKKDPP
jgi:hypothetical protein